MARTEGTSHRVVQIFLNYAREDVEVATGLYQRLLDAGYKPWMDLMDIKVGEIWRTSIERELRRSDFFLVVLSNNSVGKRGFLQNELKIAYQKWQEFCPDDIYIIPVQLDDCAVPEFLDTFQRVDYFKEDSFSRILEAIKEGVRRRNQSPGLDPPSPPEDDQGASPPRLVTVSATAQSIPTGQAPRDFRLPSGHLYIEPNRGSGGHVLYRDKDQHLVLFIPAANRLARPFLIDKYPVTNSQYAEFLNSPETRARTRVDEIKVRDKRLRLVTNMRGERLLADADSYWEVYKLSGEAWGLTRLNGSWGPLSGSGHMPVTLVTALGASCYAAWARQHNTDIHIGYGLPSEDQWKYAALWDPAAGRLRRFPWGDQWDYRKVNSVSLWAEGEVERVDKDPKSKYQLSLIKAQPTPVGAFPGGSSPSGMTDAFGNVWEWLSSVDNVGQQMLKGGAYSSPKSTFPDFPPYFVKPDRLSEAVGFRCCWQLD